MGCTTGKKLNRHLYDVRQNNVASSELAKFFITNDLNLKHLKLHILKKIFKFTILKTHEDGCVIKLLTSRLSVMNRLTGEFLKIYTKLFY